MGYNFAHEMGLMSTGQDPMLSIAIAVEQNLRYNHYPPIPVEMTAACIEAIEALVEEDFERLIKTPFVHREYGSEVPAWVIRDECHLHGFVDALSQEQMLRVG